MAEYDEIIIQCIKNKDLDELTDTFRNCKRINIKILYKILESNDYDIIKCFGDSQIICGIRQVFGVLFFEKREILKLLIKNDTQFIKKYSIMIMENAIENEDYEIMELLKDVLDQKRVVLCVDKGLDMIKFAVSMGAIIDSTVFNRAILINDFDIVRYIYENGYVNVMNDVKIEFHLLYDKYNNLSIEMMEFLINMGIDSANINQLLMAAVLNNNAILVEYLINNGAYSLDFRNGHRAISFTVFSLLIDNKVVMKDNIFRFSYINFNSENYQYMVDNGIYLHYDYDVLLSENVLNGNMENITFLLDNGADIHTACNEPLNISMIKGNLDLVKFLLNRMHISSNDIILAYAVSSGNLTLVQYLVDYYNATIDEESLSIGVEGGYLDIFNYLIKNDVIVNKWDELLQKYFTRYEFDVEIDYYNRADISKKDRIYFKTEIVGNVPEQDAFFSTLMVRCNPSALKKICEENKSQIYYMDNPEIHNYLQNLGIIILLDDIEN